MGVPVPLADLLRDLAARVNDNLERSLAQDDDERTALAHVRGWCHNADQCPVCRAFADGKAYGQKLAIDDVAQGQPIRREGGS